ncbi:DNA mismatch repair protein MSH4 [Morella rubra]|uniref:DNA mismatch repair protein MSH4 n=1 Tax=Morella rubra TaxID=262757 RepID=A0A6A1VYN8_9ROSI|nr:DNA mismatch repair protein MSH4 [Morella rubra]
MVVIVTPNKLAPDGMVGVSELVDRFYATAKKVVMARGCFDDTKGAMLVKNLAAKELSALSLDTYYKQYYLCLAAAAATIKWTEAEKGVIVTNQSLSVTFNGSFDHMNIDTTRTRLLRANILQPLKDIETINARLDCLDELMSNEQLFFGLSQVLRKFPREIDRVLCHFCFKPKKVTNEVLGADYARKSQMLISSIILLKTALDALPLLSKVLKDAKSFLLANIYKSVCENEKYASIRKRYVESCPASRVPKWIGEVIDEDVLHARIPFIARTQQCFAVKAGIDGLLDIARRSFCDTSEAIHNLANKYREDFKLPNLKLPFNNRQGFYFNIPQKDIQGKLPSKFIQVLKHGKNIHCSTLELASVSIMIISVIIFLHKSVQRILFRGMRWCCNLAETVCDTTLTMILGINIGKENIQQLNVRNKSAAAECYTQTEVCLEALLDAIREDVSVLTLLAEVLCLLDMIVNSFAHTISTKPVDRYTRPEFTDNGPIAIDAGRHPILESIHNDFVPNNLFLSEASNMVIVMGPNMSGKSTYLQQVCLIVILAQIGCYVPAHFSTLRVVDRIFTRMGAVDNLESNSSTFMTEMKETAFIMQNISQRSLIVMDELGRATSSSDGFAIAWSCCEYLLSLKAYTIFATHMENLSELAIIYPNVKLLHFHVDIRNNRLDFKFHLKEGPRHVPHYGLLLAEVAGLPSSVIETARSITSKITEKIQFIFTVKNIKEALSGVPWLLEHIYLFSSIKSYLDYSGSQRKEVKRMEVNYLQYHPIQMAYHVAQRLICLKYSSQDEDSIRQALQDLKEQYVDRRL